MGDPKPSQTRHRDGRDWRLGAAEDVAWIKSATQITLAVTSAIPPVFDAYATLLIPNDSDDRDTHDLALIGPLAAQAGGQGWWLGYLETGADDVVFPDAPRVVLYSGWPYVFVLAGPHQAMTWRSNHGLDSWRGALPDVMFPEDRSWLVSHLWDDDWRCVGGDSSLVGELVGDATLLGRVVALGEDATPPGFQSL